MTDDLIRFIRKGDELSADLEKVMGLLPEILEDFQELNKALREFDAKLERLWRG